MERKIREQTEKLAEAINKEEYVYRYMCGVRRLKGMIDQFNNECKRQSGRSPVSMVFYRMKSAESIAGKLKKKGYEITAENAEKYLNDLAGVRVVCASGEDVYLVDEFLRAQKELRIVKRKDYIKKPKASGYQSIHLIAELMTTESIRLEIQIRTMEMHFWAEEDHHLFYKADEKG